MNDEYTATYIMKDADEIANETIIFMSVDTNPVLYRHRNIDRIQHSLDPVGYQGRLSH